jgi:hypothetical protein
MVPMKFIMCPRDVEEGRYKVPPPGPYLRETTMWFHHTINNRGLLFLENVLKNVHA